MKRIFSTTLAALATVGALSALALVSTEADARTFHGRARVGVYIGGPVIAPWRPYYGYGYGYYGYPYGYPYYTAPVVVQEQPTVYVEQQPDPAVAGQAAPAPAPSSAPQAQQQQYWYYCQDSKTYYPHVQNCTSPWQRVLPHAPQ